jgi:hypothetical protein
MVILPRMPPKKKDDDSKKKEEEPVSSLLSFPLFVQMYHETYMQFDLASFNFATALFLEVQESFHYQEE